MAIFFGCADRTALELSSQRSLPMNQKLPISVIVLTFNEQANIGPCLRTIAGWAHEVFVVDSGSTDRTLDIVRTFTDKVVYHPFENYSKQRNWAQTSLPLGQEWVCHIDADERVTPHLESELRRFFASAPAREHVKGLMIRRQIVFAGRHIKHGGIYPSYTCRIFRRFSGSCEDREYDQHFVVNGHTHTLEADLQELTAASLFSWTGRHNKWAQMEARQLLKGSSGRDTEGVQAKLTGSPIERRRWLRSSVYARSPMFLRAFLYFLSRYVVRGGFLDGVPGLIYHVLQGFWFRFYVDACCYELINPKQFTAGQEDGALQSQESVAH